MGRGTRPADARSPPGRRLDFSESSATFRTLCLSVMFSCKQIEAILNAELEEALARFNRIRRSRASAVNAEHEDATNALRRALERHSDFILKGIVPDDLKQVRPIS